MFVIENAHVCLCLAAVRETNLFVVFVCRQRHQSDFSPRGSNPSDAGCALEAAAARLLQIVYFFVPFDVIVFQADLFACLLRLTAVLRVCFFVVLRVLLVFRRVWIAGCSLLSAKVFCARCH